ncbi:hypothetical protein BOO22_20775 [Vibrio cidicii]|nr:hypothetical protein [Vibrio cidicii]
MVKDWPVIVQGALGSALFWLVSLLAQKAFTYGFKYYSNRSKTNRLSWLISRDSKHEAFGGTSDHATAAYATSALIYRSLRPVYKGVVWLGLGLIASAFSPLGLAIGGVGLTYYFLKAYDVVSPISIEENTQEQWDKVRGELNELVTERLNKK